MRLISAAGVLTLSLQALAGNNVWTQFGPSGGFVSDVAVDPANPTTVYAATAGGVYKSLDRGDSWQWASEGIFSGYGRITTVAVDPSDSEVVLASDTRLFRTEDGGDSWQLVNGFTTVHGRVNEIAFDPTDPTIVYAATDLTCIAKSLDGGLTWDRADEGIESPRRCYDVVIGPDNPETVYASNNAGIYKTENGGESWTLKNNGLPSRFQLSYLALVPVAMQQPELYATNSFGTEVSLFKSTDGGDTWTPSNNGLPDGGAKYLAHDSINDQLFVITPDGPYTSANGADWTSAGQGHPKDPNFGSLTIDSANPEVLYSTNASGIFRTADSADTWTQQNEGIRALTVTEIEFDPGTPGAMYAGTTSGELWKSENDGQAWAAIDFGPGAEVGYIFEVATHPLVPETVFTFGIQGDLLRSIDGGATWEEIGLGLGGNPNDLAIDPFSVEPVLESRIYVGGSNQALHVSLDSGETFTFEDVLDDVSNAYEIAFDPLDSNYLFAALSNAGVARSTDSGKTWSLINDNIILEPGIAYFDVDINPNNSDQVLLRGNRYLYRTDDAGDTWNLVDLESSPQTVLIHPSNERVILGAEGDILLSKDGAHSFRSIGSGLPEEFFNGFVYDVEIDPSDERRIVVSNGSTALWELTLIEPELAFTPASLEVVEGGAPVLVNLQANAAPASAVTFSVSTNEQCTATPEMITIGPDTTAQQVEIDAEDDFLIDGNQDCLLQLGVADSDDGIWHGFQPDALTLTAADNTQAGVAVDGANPLKVIEYGGSRSIRLALTSIPEQSVTLSLIPSDETEVQVTPASITFSPDASAMDAQLVTVAGVDDADTDGTVASTIGLQIESADLNYDALDVPGLDVLTHDDEQVIFLGDFE